MQSKPSLNQPLSPSYNPEEVEAFWAKWWREKNYFTADSNAGKNTHTNNKFIMVIPPPNVTGSLHIGHGLTMAIEDCLTRWNRMKGKVTLWVPGMDHAGIATQSVVERHIAKYENKHRIDFSRTDFVNRVWEWKNLYGGKIYGQLDSLGISADFTRDAFTMSPALSKAVNEAIVRLFEDGLIYRANRLVSWSATLQTALSEIEVTTEEIAKPTNISIPSYNKTVEYGYLWFFKYNLKDGSGSISVATTRIETMLGDVAVAVHPTDERYKSMIGKELIHPFISDRYIKIIADEQVDKEYGTGAVKITPAHDRNDFEIGLRHNLEMINIYTLDGKINENGSIFEGQHRFDCRRNIEAELKKLGLLTDKKPNDKKMQIPRCSRSNDVIEHMLLPQWYLDCKEMAKKSTEAVRNGELKLIPSGFENVWFSWLDNIKDWCISRQLWWGHRIPLYLVKFDRQNSTNEEVWIAARSDEEAYEKAKQKFPNQTYTLEQDEDVLDTWFSSGLFPFSVMGWPDQTEDMEAFFPNTFLETGHDILFFWVARMVMLSLHLTGKLPFTTVYLHPIIRDAHGQKMSKSKGNVIDPLDIINGITLQGLIDKLQSGNLAEKEIKRATEVQKKDFPKGIAQCGADALRLGLLAYLNQGRSINLDINRVVGYRHFCNKLWNAVRFSLLSFPPNFQPKGLMCLGSDKSAHLHIEWIDRWILHRLSTCCNEANNSLESYNFAEAVRSIYNFWLYELCDVYLELIKPRTYFITNSYNEGKEVTHTHTAVLEVLYMCLDHGLRLLHPMIPFITEELYQRLPPSSNKRESIAISDYPERLLIYENPNLDKEMTLTMSVVKQFRSLLSVLEIHPKLRLMGYVKCKSSYEASILHTKTDMIANLAKLKALTLLTPNQPDPENVISDVLDDKIDIFLEKSDINFNQIHTKLNKRVGTIETQIKSHMKKISEAQNSTRVPEEVISTHKQKMEQLQEEFKGLNIAIQNITKYITSH